MLEEVGMCCTPRYYYCCVGGARPSAGIGAKTHRGALWALIGVLGAGR